MLFRVSALIKNRLSLACYSTGRQPSYIHNVGQDPLIYRTIGQQLDISASKYGDRVALVSLHEDRRISFRDLKTEADKMAAGFQKIGLRSGDRLGIWSPNTLNWYLIMMAAARAGLILVGLNPAYQTSEIEFCLRKVNVKAIVALENYKTQKYYEILTSIAPEIRNSNPGTISSENLPELSKVIIDSDKNFKGAFKLSEILKLASLNEVQSVGKVQDTIDSDSGCNIQFTSGTTGQPKAALLSHYNFVNNGYFIGKRNEFSDKHHKICVQVPLFHVFGAVIGVMASLLHGATLVLPAAGFNPEESLKAIKKEQCSVVYGTPTMYVDLLAKQKELKKDIGSLEIAVIGGAPSPPELYRNIKSKLNVKKVKTMFGMTELTAVQFQSLPNDTDDKVNETIGYIQEHLEAKVINENGKIVPFGERGELCIRGYNSMLEYWGDPDKTNEIYGKDKWVKTGDQFVLQEDGYGKIVGRLKDMIIRGGENLFPKEIEDFLTTHPKIQEVQCVGVPDDRMGEEICAFVKLAPGHSLKLDELKQFCKGKIAHFKIPRYLEVIDNFPKTQSGKIQKFKMLEQWKGNYIKN